MNIDKIKWLGCEVYAIADQGVVGTILFHNAYYGTLAVTECLEDKWTDDYPTFKIKITVGNKQCHGGRMTDGAVLNKVKSYLENGYPGTKFEFEETIDANLASYHFSIKK